MNQKYSTGNLSEVKYKFVPVLNLENAMKMYDGVDEQLHNFQWKMKAKISFKLQLLYS
jgi:hypothetical protein